MTIAQFFGSMMNMAAKILEHEAHLHPLQVLFARMSITLVLSYIYMWWKSTPDYPFGHRSIRWLLIARGLFGFLGIYGIWSSLVYLGLGEATVLTFLTPSVAGYASYILLHETFTVVEQLASVLAFGGVVVIAQPTSLFAGKWSNKPKSPTNYGQEGLNIMNTMQENATPYQRLFAIGMGMLGVIGASGAYTLIRWIGKRAHPLVSVTYFSGTSTVVSAIVLAAAPPLGLYQPDLRFDMPRGMRQWVLLVFTGACGFILQFLLTAGLRSDKSNRATMAMYTQMIFAVAFDWLVFGKVMDWTTGIGCVMIICSAIWVNLAKQTKADEKKPNDVEEQAREPDQQGLLEGCVNEDPQSCYGTVDRQK